MKSEIENINHQIAEFMDDYYDTGLEPAYYIRKNKVYELKDAQYHSSWDWLMTVVDRIEELGFRVYITQYSCQIYQIDKSFPDNFIIDADFKETRLENAVDGISAFAEWWNKKEVKPAIDKRVNLVSDINEFIDDWLIEKVVFKEDRVFEKELRPGKTKKYYPVHPKGTSTRKYLEERMRNGIERLFRIRGKEYNNLKEDEMVFILDSDQVKAYREWAKSKTLPQTAIGGAFTICFTETGIGTFAQVKCVDGTTLDLTDHSKI
jgi:hypothetical protein